MRRSPTSDGRATLSLNGSHEAATVRPLPLWYSFHIGLDMRFKHIIDVPETALDVTIFSTAWPASVNRSAGIIVGRGHASTPACSAFDIILRIEALACG